MAGLVNEASKLWNYTRQEGDCWVWTRCRFENGYGAFKVANKQWRTHRLAWTLMHGEIPAGLQVNHHCDNKACINPAHLYVGDQKQNRQDAVRRGRTAKGIRNGMYTHPESRSTGERNSNHKITDEQRADMRIAYAQGGVTLSQLGKQYGITAQSVYSSVKRI